MEASEQTKQQIARALRKVAVKFPAGVEPLPLTDIYLQMKQESGELLIFDDNDVELTRCVVEDWINNTDENFYDEVQPILRLVIKQNADVTEHLNVLRPYSFVLTDDDGETVAELYLVDDDTILLSDDDFMPHLSDDLDRFWERLEKE